VKIGRQGKRERGEVKRERERGGRELNKTWRREGEREGEAEQNLEKKL
jgi:hypothetical protein